MVTARLLITGLTTVPRFVGLAVLLHASAAQASPTIAVSSPTVGQPLYDLRPTIVIAYTSDDPAVPLDLATLRVTANGFDWTGKFTVGPDSASYTVTAAEELIAGRLTIAASIRDSAGASASITADFDVYPALAALAPSTAEVGDTVTLMASGLDPAPANNNVLLNPDGLTTALSVVDRSTDTGRFTLPAGTTSGNVGLEVNGRAARERLGLNVPSVVPNCGLIRSLFAMADGAWLVAYNQVYWWDPVDPRCPPVQVNDGSGAWRFVKVTTAGELQRLSLPVGNGGYGVRIIPNKRRSDAAILIRNYPSLPVVVRYKDVDTFLYGWVWAADFDRDGNLYVVFYERAFRIWRISKEALARGGDATMEPIVDLPVQFGGLEPYGFVVSCDGFAYAVVNLQLNDYPWVQPRIFKVDLAARQIVGDRLFGLGEELGNLALSCQTNELWSARSLNIQKDSSAAIARTEITANGFGVSEDVFVTPAAAFPIGVAIGATGNVYFVTGTNAILAKRAAIEACPVSTGALPVCQSAAEVISILPSTTRWKAQKDNSWNVKIDFSSSVPVNGPATVKITGPGSSSNVVFQKTYDFRATDPPPDYYTVYWDAPQLTNPSDPKSFVPRGEYTISIDATTASGPVSTPATNDRDALLSGHRILSFIEVKSIELVPAAPLGANPEVFGLSVDPAARAHRPQAGLQIRPEAAEAPEINPASPVSDTVTVKATIEPVVEEPVPVYLRSLDVTDGSGVSTVVTSPTGVAQDNRGHTTVAGPTDALPIVAREGNLIGPAGEVAGDTAPEVDAAPGTDTVTVVLRVSRQPGDNYRVSASTTETWLKDLRAVPLIDPAQPTTLNQTGKVVDSTGQSLLRPDDSDGEQVTEMLTVWRTLHVETARLTSSNPAFDQAAMDGGGEFNLVTTDTLIDTHVGATLQTSPDHTQPNDWRGADLTLAFHQADRYEVATNLSVLATVVIGPGQPPLSNGLNPGQTFHLFDKRYWLRDDYVTSLDAAAMCWGTNSSGGNSAFNVSCKPDTSLAKKLLAEAYIDLQEYVSLTTPAIPFVVSPTNTVTNRYLVNAASLPADGRSTPQYWTVQLIGAFEGRNASDPVGTSSVDLDPNPAPGGSALAELGVTTVSYGGLKNRSVIFLEVLRDLYQHPGTFRGRLAGDFMARDTAHELMHQFTLNDEDSGLMCRTGGYNITSLPQGGALTNAEISVVRDQIIPKVDLNAPRTGTCP